MSSDKPIEIKIAKDQLKGINALLTEPHLLVGGLAVNQYIVGRDSKDIDLVCSYKTSQKIINELYSNLDWYIIDKNEDEYRPSYEIRHLSKDLGTIILGFKIMERAPYKNLPWRQLWKEATNFSIENQKLTNIFVPTVSALAYSKMISFIGRNHHPAKGKQDLQDFVDLCNNKKFSTNDFYGILKSGDFEEIMDDFVKFSKPYKSILEKSHIFFLSKLFPVKTDSNDVVSENIDIPGLGDQKIKVENVPLIEDTSIPGSIPSMIHFRKGYDWDDLKNSLKGAKSIYLCGLTLSRVFENCKDQLLEALKNGCYINVMVIDYTNACVMKTMAERSLPDDDGDDPDTWISKVKNVVKDLTSLTRNKEVTGKVAIKYLQFLPAFGLIIIDFGSDGCKCFVEIAPHRVNTHKATFELHNHGKEKIWYGYFEDQWTQLWACARKRVVDLKNK